VKAFKDFGVATYAEPERAAPNGEDRAPEVPPTGGP
jgi:hypothetical protein